MVTHELSSFPSEDNSETKLSPRRTPLNKADDAIVNYTAPTPLPPLQGDELRYFSHHSVTPTTCAIDRVTALADSCLDATQRALVAAGGSV